MAPLGVNLPTGSIAHEWRQVVKVDFVRKSFRKTTIGTVDVFIGRTTNFPHSLTSLSLRETIGILGKYHFYVFQLFSLWLREVRV